MARTKADSTVEKEIKPYTHDDKTRLNNPPVGYAQYDTAQETKKKYSYDPNLDPTLTWAGKAERTSFEIPTVSLHVHENIDPYRIIREARHREHRGVYQTTLFDTDSLKKRRESLEFYQHSRGWANRLIAGDSLLVMNSLLEKESMAGKVQMVYIDPPYGIKYGSNFQPFTDKKNVQDGKDEDLTKEPEMIKAFRDTWELGIHSYLSYLRDRITLARELLTESGSLFIQISEDNLHHVREICDEVFGPENFVTFISYASTSGFATNFISRAGDYVVWYAKSKNQIKYRQLFIPKEFGGEGGTAYKKIELKDGTRLSIAEWEKQNGCKFDYKTRPEGSRVYGLGDVTSQGSGPTLQPFEFNGKTYYPSKGNHWKAKYPEGMQRLADLKRIDVGDKSIGYVRYFDDFPFMQISNLWKDTLGQNQYGSSGKKYVVQTSLLVVQRCILMSTDPGDLVLDITCGSGTTAYLAEQWGRRWITCDTSRIAIALAKQRLLTALFDYYQLLHPDLGIAGGFNYKKVPHVTLDSLANNESPVTEDLVDQPLLDKTKVRITGPFTIEAIPSPTVKSLDTIEDSPSSDVSSKQSEWRDELKAAGILTRSGNKIQFSRVEPLSGTTYLQAEAETIEESPRKAVICFAGETRPLDARMVRFAIEEAETIHPAPKMIIFCAFQFDPEASKDIDEAVWPGVQLLQVHMNTDLLTDDLMKKRSGNQSFWMIGQPDVVCIKIEEGADKGKFQVKVRGFDYYDVKTGTVQSGNTSNIAMWMLDTDYDGMSLNPSQIFFPMAGPDEGWTKLAMTLKVELDQDLVEMYRGVESIPFSLKPPAKIAVKIIDNRGIESLKVITIGE